MARNQVAKKSVSDDGKIVLTFSNDTVLSFDPSAVNDETRKRAMEHGFLQKIGDSYAGAKTVEDAIESAKGVIESLNQNDWNQRREGGEGPDAGLLAEAMARVNGKTVEEATAFLADKTKEQKASLRALPAIVKATGEIKAERAERKAPAEDAAALLASF